MRLSFSLTEPRTNNEAEYEALVAGLEEAIVIGIQNLHIFGDSQLVINQVLGIYKINKLELAYYQKRVLELMKQITNVTLTRISRGENGKADCLAKLAKEMAVMTDEYLMIFVHTRRVLQPTSLRSPLEEGSPSTSQQDTTAVVPYTPLQIAPLNKQGDTIQEK